MSYRRLDGRTRVESQMREKRDGLTLAVTHIRTRAWDRCVPKMRFQEHPPPIIKGNTLY